MNFMSSEEKGQLAAEFREYSRKLQLVRAETEDCNRKVAAYRKLLDSAAQQKNKLLASNNPSDPAGGPSLRKGSFAAVVEASTRDSPKLKQSPPNIPPIAQQKSTFAAEIGVRSGLINIPKSRSIMLCYYDETSSFNIDDVFTYFSNYGVIISLTDPTGRKNKRNANYFFLKFQDYQSAEKAIANTTDHWIGKIKYSVFKAKDF